MPSPQGIRASNASTTEEVWVTFLEISHQSLSAPIRVCDNGESLTRNGEVYVSFPFQLELPSDGGEGHAQGRLRIDDIGEVELEDGRSLRIPDILREAAAEGGKIEVTIAVALASQPDVDEWGPMVTTLRMARGDIVDIECELFLEELNEADPKDSFTPATHPGLFYG